MAKYSLKNCLGALHLDERGVFQHDVIAHFWFNISSAKRDEIGAKNRGIVATEMSAEQIAEAQQAMARECMASNYQNWGD